MQNYFRSPEAQQILDRAAFLNSLISERSFPWTKIFMDLENTLPAGVRVVNIAPTLKNGKAVVQITVGAANDESKIKFLEAVGKVAGIFQRPGAGRAAFGAGNGFRQNRAATYSIVRDYMNTTRPWDTWKKIILSALGLLLLADLALVFVLWQASREGVDSMRAQRTRLETQAKLLKADVARGDKIRASLPTVGKDCDAFYHDAFLDSSTGYSDIESDLGNIAVKSGLRVGGLTLNQKEVKGRGVTLITISESVDGDYPAIIQIHQWPGAFEIFLPAE